MPALLIPTPTAAWSLPLPAAALASVETPSLASVPRAASVEPTGSLALPTPPVHVVDETTPASTTLVAAAAAHQPAVAPATHVAAATSAPPTQTRSAAVSLTVSSFDGDALSPGPLADGVHGENTSSSAVISNLDVHDDVIRKRDVHSRRVVSAAKLRRSARIADRETPFYSTMAQKASRLKASRFNLAKASDELVAAIQGSSLCVSDGEASDADNDKLPQIALVCGADADEADVIRAAGALPSP